MAKRSRQTSRKTQISVRIAAEDLEELERIGAAAKPVPANRNQMIGVAIRHYIDHHRNREESVAGGRRKAD